MEEGMKEDGEEDRGGLGWWLHDGVQKHKCFDKISFCCLFCSY